MNLKKIDISIILLLVFAVLIHLFSVNPNWIEHYYSNEIFLAISNFRCLLFGKIVFSLGDILYGVSFFALIFLFIRFMIALFQKKITAIEFWISLKRFFLMCLVIYLVFNVFWGLNYNRLGIATQIGLDIKEYDSNELKSLNALLVEKTNLSKKAIVDNHVEYPNNKSLFIQTKNAYDTTAVLYNFLTYKNAAIKKSIWGWLGNYWGFTGYYNPFTGEAQLNTTVPKFLLPFAACHEVAHQLGYAKEKEANFVSYLVAKKYNDSLFLYSAYLDLFFYANRNLYSQDSTSANRYRELLSEDVKKDIAELVRFNKAHRNFMEPMISKIYDLFLRSNQQPQGMMSYDEVTVYLMAYWRKSGTI
jgi:Protein of unknown function (DUF3810)